MTLTLICDLDVRTRPIFSPIYATTKQKADICNSFPVIGQTDTHTDRHIHTSAK